MNSNGNSTVKWVAIIVSLLTLFFSVALGAINTKLNKHDDQIMKLIECQARFETKLDHIIKMLEE